MKKKKLISDIAVLAFLTAAALFTLFPLLMALMKQVKGKVLLAQEVES